MDCLQAAEIVASEMDGELVDAALLAQASAHCASCPECVPLLHLHARMREVPAPRAPQALVAELESAALRAAADVRDTEIVAELLPELAAASLGRRPWYQSARLLTYASAAAAVLAVFVVGTIVFRGGGQEAADQAGTLMTSEESAPAPAAPESSAAQDGADMRTAELPAPPYVVFGGAVYVQSDVPTPASLVTAGAVASDLGTGSPTSHTALAVSGTTDPIFIRTVDGRYLSFSLVTRTLGRRTYALASEEVARFGQWPTLPASLPQPASDDGSPAFGRFGFDDRGADVYVPANEGANEGFAIAPGTPADDPAAGNPNWTWWVPVR